MKLLRLFALLFFVPVSAFAQNTLQSKTEVTVPAGDDWLYVQGATNDVRKLSPTYYQRASTLNGYFADPSTNGSFSASAWKVDLSLNNVENTALSTWAGTTNLITLGTISTGTWQGTAIGETYIASALTRDTEWDTAAEINAATTDTNFLTQANNLSDVGSAATSRTNLGASTVGSAFFTLTNPSAVTFPRINADNTVDTRTAANLKADLSLENVTNTSDANKPVSTATQTALNLKASLSALIAVNGSGINTGGLVDWSQLMNVPAGFADGTDDGAGGGSGTMTTVKEDDAAVGAATAVAVDFGSGFDVAAASTDRNVTLDLSEVATGGDLSWSGNTPTIAANAVALATDTTGNYVATVTGTTNEIEVSGSGSENAGVTVGLPDDVVIGATATLPNTGLHLLDTNASHDLIIAPGSNITADRTLTITTGDADRTLTLSGNVTISGSTSGTNTGDQTSVTGNAGTATALQTARNINGTAFDGTADVTVTAAAGTLTGTTLNSSVVTSSLTAVGTLATGTWSATAIAVNKGGTGQTSYTDGQLLIGNSSGNTLAKATLTAGNGITITNGGGTITITAQEVIQLAASDPSTAITAGTGKITFRAPYAFTLTGVRASVTTAPTGSTAIFDINEAGSTVLSTKLSIDASEKTSVTAASAAVISDSVIADDAEITIDFDQVGASVAGAGVVITLYITR